MIEQCKQYYHGNNKELQLIDEFERTYTKSNTISWYTKEYFIYRLCNKALRIQDIEWLYILYNYIQDLCQNLKIKHELFKKQQEELNQSIIKVYYGFKITKYELNKFQTNIGSIISINGFLLTNRNYNLALDIALKNSKNSIEILPIVFIIEIDTNIDHIIFADISSDKQEILFDINCGFKINEVHFDDEKNIWIVNMNLTNEGKQIIETYIEANKDEMEKGNIFLIFGLLLIEMEQYNQAEIYFEYLLSSNIINDKIAISTNLGRIKYLKGLYDEALKDFQIVYNIQQQQTPNNDIDIARTMHNLGLIYMEQNKYDLALNYLLYVINSYKNFSNIDKILSANTDNAIGVIFCHKRDYNQALKYLFHAMNIYQEYLPTIDHTLMAINYNNIGLVYYYMNEYTQSLIYCLKSFDIRKKILSINHSNIGDSYNNLALIYQKLREYEQALKFFQQSLLIYEKNLNKKMNIPICFINIGLLYIDQNNFNQAINYYLKALDFYNNNNNNDQNIYEDEIIYTLDNLGIAYECKEDFEQALKYYKQALECQQQEQNKFVQISLKIGNIYQKTGEYDLALDYYEKGLKKSQTSSPELFLNLLMAIGMIHHRQNKYKNALIYYKQCLFICKNISYHYDLNLAWIYNNIGCLYLNTGDLNRALKYQEKAYYIRKKSLLSTHLDLATSLTNIGHIHQTLAHCKTENLNEIDQALENYKAAFHIRRKSLPNDHPDLAKSYYNLALIHIDQQEYEQAYFELQKALNIQKKIFPLNHSDLQQTLKYQQNIQTMLDYSKK